VVEKFQAIPSPAEKGGGGSHSIRTYKTQGRNPEAELKLTNVRAIRSAEAWSGVAITAYQGARYRGNKELTGQPLQLCKPPLLDKRRKEVEQMHHSL
jgi:hypothetical protein